MIDFYSQPTILGSKLMHLQQLKNRLQALPKAERVQHERTIQQCHQSIATIKRWRK